MTRVFSWLLLLVVLGAFGAVIYQVLRARAAAGRDMPPYSVYLEDQHGLAAAATLLRKLGWEPVALTLPVQQTEQRDAKSCLLILAEPEETALMGGRISDLSEPDVQGLLRWVEQGNTLLLCSRHTTALHRALGLVVMRPAAAGADEETDVALGEAGGYTDHIDRLVVEGREVLRGGAGLPLWWLDDEPGALLLSRGQGRMLVIADPWLLTPDGLRRADNARFLVNAAALDARDGRVYFDEYHHGLHSGGGFWGYLGVHDQRWTVLLLVLVVAVAAWSVAVRLGRPVPAPAEDQADAVDYASAVARIYQRAGVRHLLARTLRHDFLAALTRHLHLRRAALPAEVLAAWRRQHAGEADQQVEDLLRGVTRLGEAEISRGELLAWARAFDRFKAEVLRVR